MANSEYWLVREFVIRIGQPLMLLILVLSLALIMSAVLPRMRKSSHTIALVLVSATAVGWLILVFYHYKISTSLELIDPTGQLPPGRFMIPVWIENEKLYFWTLVLGILTVLGFRRPSAMRAAQNVTFGGFGILTFFTSNPFAEPLSEFHASFNSYLTVMAGGQNIAAKTQSFYQLYGRMVGYYNSTYMWVHPPLLFIAYSTFVLSFLGCVFMLLRRRDDYYEKLAYSYAKAGFILLTIGILIGYPWAVAAWEGEPWWYDPKINVTLMMWLLYSAYLHARLYLHRKGMWTTTAVLGYLGFLGLIVTYLTTYVIPGIHSVVN